MIGKSVVFVIVSLFLGTFAMAQPLTGIAPEITSPALSSVNKEYPRSEFMTYPKREMAFENDYEKSVYYQSLDGEWKFKYVEDSRDLREEYHARFYNDSTWSRINVPGTWENQGICQLEGKDGEYDFPVKGKSLELPDKIAAGVYRTTFKVPYEWDERQIFLSVGAARSGSVIYVNGEKVGYAADSKNPAEFDITSFVHEGINQLTIETYRWSSASFLETQDGTRFSGITRNVHIICQPKVRVRDFIMATSLDPTYQNGMLQLGVVIKSHYLNPKEVRVYYDCLDPEGETVSYESKYSRLRMRLEDTVYFNIPIPSVRKWSAETPDLYTILVRVQREDGRFTEYITTQMGFRTVEVKDNRLLVNGKPVFIRGVNLKEKQWSSEAEMEKELIELKKLNVNAIRCEGYPMPSRFYELCDRYGFYVNDMANIDAKGSGNDRRKGKALGNNPRWVEAYKERVLNMYERDKNHPSVIMWTLANGGGNGYNLYKAYQLLKEKDSMRPIQYEQALLEWNNDIFCPVSANKKELERWASTKADRPYIISVLNDGWKADNGDLWSVIKASPNFQGGFMAGKSDDLKKVYQPIDFFMEKSSPEQLVVKVQNNFNFADLSDYNVYYEIANPDKTVASGDLSGALAAGENKEFTIDISKVRRASNTEYTITLYVAIKTPAQGLDVGYVIAKEQFIL
ncbi:MAG TPA: DUF4981 domain-containing protein [Candidatus Avirikenella pullistercoris]|nr:DUF4981 domain-containing protein [Candidatus Avirikenella pullistercoris]